MKTRSIARSQLGMLHARVCGVIEQRKVGSENPLSMASAGHAAGIRLMRFIKLSIFFQLYQESTLSF